MALFELLVDLYTPEEFRRLIHLAFDRSVHVELPETGATHAKLVGDIIEVLDARSLIGPWFFALLERERERRIEDIRGVAGLWRDEQMRRQQTADAEERARVASVRSRRTLYGAAFAVMAVALGRYVWLASSSGAEVELSLADRLRAEYDEDVIDAVVFDTGDGEQIAVSGFLGEDTRLHLQLLRHENDGYVAELDRVVPSMFDRMDSAELLVMDIRGEDGIDEMVWGQDKGGGGPWGAFVVSVAPAMEGWVLCDDSAGSGWSGCKFSGGLEPSLAHAILEVVEAPDGAPQIDEAVARWRAANRTSAPYHVQAVPLDLRALDILELVRGETKPALQRLDSTVYFVLADDPYVREVEVLVELDCDVHANIDSWAALEVRWAACTAGSEEAICGCLGEARVRYTYEGGGVRPRMLGHRGALYLTERADILSVFTPPDVLERHGFGEQDIVLSDLVKQDDRVKVCHRRWPDGRSGQDGFDLVELRRAVECPNWGTTVERCATFAANARPLIPDYGVAIAKTRDGVTHTLARGGCLFGSSAFVTADDLAARAPLPMTGDARVELLFPPPGERCPVDIDVSGDAPRPIDWTQTRRPECARDSTCMDLTIAWWGLGPDADVGQALVWSGRWQDSIHVQFGGAEVILKQLPVRPPVHEGRVDGPGVEAIAAAVDETWVMARQNWLPFDLPHDLAGPFASAGALLKALPLTRPAGSDGMPTEPAPPRAHYPAYLPPEVPVFCQCGQ